MTDDDLAQCFCLRASDLLLKNYCDFDLALLPESGSRCVATYVKKGSPNDYGTVKWFNAQKGFDSSSRTPVVPMHSCISSTRRHGAAQRGQKVSFELVQMAQRQDVG